MRFAFVAVTLLGLYPAVQANAHEIRPGLLDIKELDTGWYNVTWKVPTRGDRQLAIEYRLPDSLELLGSPPVQTISGARIQRATYKRNGEPGASQNLNGL